MICEETPARAVARRMALDTVLPRPHSPNGSVHWDSDEEMKETLLGAMSAVESSSVGRLKKARSFSEKSLNRYQRPRYRRKPQGSINSNISTEVTEEPSWRRSHQVSTPSFSLDVSTDDHHSIVADYMGEVRKMRELKQCLSKGVLKSYVRPGSKSPVMSLQSRMSRESHLSRTRGARSELGGELKKVQRKKARTKAYVQRIQSVIYELRGSLDRSHRY